MLEKDNTVDSLQRKVCGLQAEMRIVVKENSELNRQLVSLNQRVDTPSCCHSCQGTSSNAPSSPSSPRAATYSCNSSVRREEYSSPCKNLYQERMADTIPPPALNIGYRTLNCIHDSLNL